MSAEKKSPRIGWPQGKAFAFSIFDDTDNDNLENTRPVYDLLASCGYRTTKSCWVRSPGPDEAGSYGGKTTEDPEYLEYLLGLQRLGFEIGLHNVSWASSTREQIEAGLARFATQFGHPPRVLANHAGTGDSIYWGPARLSGLPRMIYNLLTRYRNCGAFAGEVDSSPYFWGDLCSRHVQYVRNFTYTQVDTMGVCPEMPYHDAARPYVNKWFASCDGHDLPTFLSAMREANQDRLEACGGCCIMYTHFAKGFAEKGEANTDLERLMRRLSRKAGWFVPVGEMLDYIAQQRGDCSITRWQRARLEWRWLWQKVKMGGTT